MLDTITEKLLTLIVAEVIRPKLDAKFKLCNGFEPSSVHGPSRLRIVSKDFDRVALNAYLTNNNVLAVIHPRIPDNRREAVGGLAMATARREARTQPFRSLGHPN